MSDTSRFVTMNGERWQVKGEVVRFRLEIGLRSRRGTTFKMWAVDRPYATVPTFAQSGRGEDLLPLVLVEKVESEFGEHQNRWDLECVGTSFWEGELRLHFSVSVANSKKWPLERCLMEMGWKQER